MLNYRALHLQRISEKESFLIKLSWIQVRVEHINYYLLPAKLKAAPLRSPVQAGQKIIVMRKREKIRTVLTTVNVPIYLIPVIKQKPVKALAFPTAGIFSFSLSRVLLPPTE
ncbi:hypothetical protein [Mucilaginibacter sp. 10B2]|uniref:hypothetical protein n=1 Tax=Mucilaginibacter sp. 10B2 TaxID=3048574 RepID=UPI002B22AD0B|nr:hypothetical protein [Mucilaginibacter sp. 10B2]MEB0278219.1 hypothetical protein [Mucilaginibacter sp. 10B2]